ncbi:MAG: hypothetical protein ACRDOY_05020 [Nocardioidaceae bacterium]
MLTRPTLLHSCARAATAAEARFRIDVPIAPARASRIIALDEVAAVVVRHVAAQAWATARFFTWDGSPGSANGDGQGADALTLRSMEGRVVLLGETLAGVDVAVMVAAGDVGADAAERIGRACTARGIMTAGLILSDDAHLSRALAALRPHARVLIVPAEQDDLVQLLTALRA